LLNRFLKWCIFRRYPRLRAVLSELCVFKGDRQWENLEYAIARGEDWMAVAQEVLYGKPYLQR